MSNLTSDKKLLIVDDEIDIAESMKHFLHEEGIDADTVFSGKEALESLKMNTYQGIILDWIMPDMTGKEVLDEVKKSGLNIPVLVISAVPHSKVSNEITEDLSFLQKPFDLDEFIEVVKKLAV